MIELKAIFPGSVVEVTRRFLLQIGLDRHHYPSESSADHFNAAEKIAGHRLPDTTISLVKLFQEPNKQMSRR
jgi:hypothetical protein